MQRTANQIGTVTGTEVAIKVNKNRPHIFNQARREIEILKRLRGLDPDTCNIVKWNGFFFHKENICLNFELLDKSLHDYRVHRRNANLSMRELRPVIHQLATALSHLSSKQIVHADLKPENVMVVDSTQQQIRVRLIDFGLAHPRFGTDPGACVQTTWYRAPEVIIQLPFDEAIDMWSLGLTIVEMATGYPMYPGDTEYDVLRYIVETQGQPPDHMLDSGVCTKYYFATQNIVSSVCKARPENVHHGQVVSLTDESESSIDKENGSQPETNAENQSWLRRLVGKISDTLCVLLAISQCVVFSGCSGSPQDKLIKKRKGQFSRKKGLT
uniref:Protein kinase domain-containing protein n=1 Tax=Sparus aurata TaxID=8175 RepID=A0A671YFF6_SPAAU